MVDIDRVVCDFCKLHLTENTAAFDDPRLELINDDARSQLENYPGAFNADSASHALHPHPRRHPQLCHPFTLPGTFDVIIGDLADPVFGGPCYQLYTDDFYKNVVSVKLNDGGVFVTQSGPCGVLSAGEVFAPIHHTLRATFDTVLPYCTHIPSFVDEWVRCWRDMR